MAFVAVNKDGTEVIGEELTRCLFNRRFGIEPISRYDPTIKINASFWANIYNDPDEGYCDVSVELPKGSIKKLIGKELTWDDEPVELH